MGLLATEPRGHGWDTVGMRRQPLLIGSVHPISVLELTKNEVVGGKSSLAAPEQVVGARPCHVEDGARLAA